MTMREFAEIITEKVNKLCYRHIFCLILLCPKMEGKSVKNLWMDIGVLCGVIMETGLQAVFTEIGLQNIVWFCF